MHNARAMRSSEPRAHLRQHRKRHVARHRLVTSKPIPERLAKQVFEHHKWHAVFSLSRIEHLHDVRMCDDIGNTCFAIESIFCTGRTQVQRIEYFHRYGLAILFVLGQINARHSSATDEPPHLVTTIQ